jgi:kumamolisin
VDASRITLDGSEPIAGSAVRPLLPAERDRTIEVTVLVKRHANPAAEERMARILRGEAPPLSREEAEREMGAAPEALQRIAGFAAECGFTVVEASAAKNSVKVSGSAAQMAAAFGADLGYERVAGTEYLTYRGPLTIPAALQDIVAGVLGLDDRPVARLRE